MRPGAFSPSINSTIGLKSFSLKEAVSGSNGNVMYKAKLRSSLPFKVMSDKKTGCKIFHSHDKTEFAVNFFWIERPSIETLDCEMTSIHPNPQIEYLLGLLFSKVNSCQPRLTKADDRLLSLIFNENKLLCSMKIIQLPIEYLWLTLDYNELMLDTIYDYNKRLMKKSILIEHSECLTSEDTAASGGASSDRTPANYKLLDLNMEPVSEQFHEYIYRFPTFHHPSQKAITHHFVFFEPMLRSPHSRSYHFRRR